MALRRLGTLLFLSVLGIKPVLGAEGSGWESGKAGWESGKAGWKSGKAGWESGKAAFEVHYKGESSPFSVNGVFLMPGEILDLKISGRQSGTFSLEFAKGTGGPAGPRAWNWKAPDTSGLYTLTLRRDSTDDRVRFNAFVMIPAAEMKGEYLRGYRIGKYPGTPLKGLEFYRNPKGFILADSVSVNARVSPHFRLGQFLCKQSAELPAVLLLKERLVLKLEMVLEKANEAGYPCNTFHVMSGYRTPFYNKAIGNVKLSAHQFGGAADIFIDNAPVNGEMDDLNGDGISDGLDSGLLFDLVDKLSVNEYFLPYIGGIGKYSKNRSHGAFVHVDVRGFRVIW
ncbi:MAG: D-Ala-D-Ala carboxypeptidase family metallohydrolase [Fibrobacterota bacterium]|nr:D-Ala-D-Ala carboxypeptidase family metallohydrolase [Fibrobacterota bacterium]